MSSNITCGVLSGYTLKPQCNATLQSYQESFKNIIVIPESVLLGEDGECGLEECLEHVEEALDAGAPHQAELVDEDGAEVEEAGVRVARAVDAHHLRHQRTQDGLGLMREEENLMITDTVIHRTGSLELIEDLTP